MAFNWAADSVVALFKWLGAADHKIVDMMSSWDTGVYIIVAGVFLYVNRILQIIATPVFPDCHRELVYMK